MKKKSGFVFIETIITIVFLASALMLLFSSYQNAITDEKESVYYDDISYLYRNYYVAEFLINKTNITKILETKFTNGNYTMDIKSIVNDPNKSEELYSESQISQSYPSELKNIMEEFNIYNLVVVSDKIITECYDDENKCKDSYEGLDKDFANYIKTMKLVNNDDDEEETTEYYLVVEYREKDTVEEGIKKCEENEENCVSFYANLKLDITPKTDNENHFDELCIGQRLGKCLTENYDVENNDEGGIYHHDENLEGGAQDDSYRYSGKNPNNYICFGTNNKTTCINNKDTYMYRIIGIFNNKLKIIKEKGETKSWTQVNVLNDMPDNWKNIVEESEWKTGGSTLTGTAKDIYDAEVKNAISKKNSESGLMYVSDYMYGASPSYWHLPSDKYNEAKENNWLYKSEEWLISSISGTSKIYEVKDGGAIGELTARNLTNRGSMYLKDTVILLGGTGTKEDPYRITDTGAVINSLNGEAGYNDIKVTVNAFSSDGNIVKYLYSINKGSGWSNWVETKNNFYTFTNLLENTNYQIKVKVLNSRGNYSEEKSLNVKTKIFIPPTVTINSTSATSSSITMSVTGNPGTNSIKEYRYYLNGALITTKADTSNTFGGLSPYVSYTIGVAAVDSENNVSEIVPRSVATAMLDPTLRSTKVASRTGAYCYNCMSTGCKWYDGGAIVVVRWGDYYKMRRVNYDWYQVDDKWGDQGSDKSHVVCYVQACKISGSC